MNHLCKQSQWPEANRRNVQKPPRRRAIDTGAKFLMRRNIVGFLESRDREPKRECFLKSFVRASSEREETTGPVSCSSVSFNQNAPISNQRIMTKNNFQIRNKRSETLKIDDWLPCTSYKRFVSRFFSTRTLHESEKYQDHNVDRLSVTRDAVKHWTCPVFRFWTTARSRNAFRNLGFRQNSHFKWAWWNGINVQDVSCPNLGSHLIWNDLNIQISTGLVSLSGLVRLLWKNVLMHWRRWIKSTQIF